MRSREEIERQEYRGEGWKIDPKLEVLLDIRDLLQNPPIEIAGVPTDQGEPLEDPLFDDAKATFIAAAPKTPSAQLLREALGISYGRASALIDQLEAAGVITAPDPITHRRRVV